MLEGKDVSNYFLKHPESVERLNGFKYQTGTGENMTERTLEASDIKYISFKGWNGEAGVFAWYYPNDIPHYIKIN